MAEPSNASHLSAEDQSLLSGRDYSMQHRSSHDSDVVDSVMDELSSSVPSGTRPTVPMLSFTKQPQETGASAAAGTTICVLLVSLVSCTSGTANSAHCILEA